MSLSTEMFIRKSYPSFFSPTGCLHTLLLVPPCGQRPDGEPPTPPQRRRGPIVRRGGCSEGGALGGAGAVVQLLKVKLFFKFNPHFFVFFSFRTIE